MKKGYTIEEKEGIGKQIADILNIPKHQDRYITTWGTKTAIGIFETILTIADNIKLKKEI